jgi:cell wall-associated NlpC family hydrolase
LPIETQATGFSQAVARVNEITRIAAGAAAPAAPAADGFAGRLDAAMGGGAGAPATTTTASPFVSASLGTVPGLAPVAAAGGGGPLGQQIAALATAELGVAEAPPGSNDAPRIAEYRTATAGSGVGPWCAYFTSWVAAQAGVPIGPGGSGLGYVPTVKQWAEDTGRWVPAGAGPPQVGDLVVFDRGGDGVLDHIGVVTGVSPDGSIQTVEGNSSNRVSARSYGPDGYAGLVRLVPPGS